MSDYKDIWPGDEGNSTLTEEQLLAYMEGRLPDDERHAVEAMLSDEGMESDALEGLQTLSADEATGMSGRLNAQLKKTLGKKRRTRRSISDQRWTWIAVGVILLITILCYAMMWVMKHPAP